ncbi:hypothetical protein AeRB84_014554, partial [Aphanomyces euteiches]
FALLLPCIGAAKETQVTPLENSQKLFAKAADAIMFPIEFVVKMRSPIVLPLLPDTAADETLHNIQMRWSSNKVHEVRLPVASGSCTRWSLACNSIFVLSLASTPLMAYLTEPHPGQGGQFPTWSSFDDYVNVTAAYFRVLYNNQTMLVNSCRDVAVNTFGIQREMTLPFEISTTDTLDYLIRMPGSFYFGQGIRSFLETFLRSNATTRLQLQPWQMCQHRLLLATKLGDVCVWLEETNKENHYTVWAATGILESSHSLWAKFTFRSILSIYILYILWTQYYRHYLILLYNLRLVGVAPKFTRYKVVLGDPTYAVLTDPVMSLAMMVDLSWGASYFALSIIQLTQFQDVWLYVNGCMYLARSLVCILLHASCLVRVDPGFLAISAYICSGPFVSLVGRTHLVWLIHRSSSLFVAKELQGQAVEGITLSLSLILALASLPIIFSRLALWWRRQNQDNPIDPAEQMQWISSFKYNDMKSKIILALTMHKHTKSSSGGSLHKLYLENPKYRKIPTELLTVLYFAAPRMVKPRNAFASHCWLVWISNYMIPTLQF